MFAKLLDLLKNMSNLLNQLKFQSYFVVFSKFFLRSIHKDGKIILRQSQFAWDRSGTISPEFIKKDGSEMISFLT